MTKVYCYLRCSTCKKALKWLDDNKIKYEQIDIKEDHPDEKTLRQLHKKSGLPMGSLANKELRRKRYEAHLALERLWQRGYMSKADAYRWLQTQMGILEADAHIGKFTEYRCYETIRLCDGFLRKAA